MGRGRVVTQDADAAAAALVLELAKGGGLAAALAVVMDEWGARCHDCPLPAGEQRANGGSGPQPTP